LSNPHGRVPSPFFGEHVSPCFPLPALCFYSPPPFFFTRRGPRTHLKSRQKTYPSLFCELPPFFPPIFSPGSKLPLSFGIGALRPSRTFPPWIRLVLFFFLCSFHVSWTSAFFFSLKVGPARSPIPHGAFLFPVVHHCFLLTFPHGATPFFPSRISP